MVDRLRVRQLNGSKCWYCGRKTKWIDRSRYSRRTLWNLRYMDGNEFTVDHIIPKSKGGKDTYRNVCTACHTCNTWKGNLDVFEFVTKILKYDTWQEFAHSLNSVSKTIRWNENAH